MAPKPEVLISLDSGTMIDNIGILTAILGFLTNCLAEIKYFRFGRPYCYFWLSVVLAITFFELAIVENPGMQLKTNKFVVLLLKPGFHYPS